MLDLNSYLLYGLFLSRIQEQSASQSGAQGHARAVRFSLVAWTLATLGSTLVKSGRKLKDRYEPMVHTRPQTSN